MLEVDRVIRQRLDSGVPLVSEVCQYIVAAGGKRLRPALLRIPVAFLVVFSAGLLGAGGCQAPGDWCSAIVVRPDQYVAHVLPLDGFEELSRYFAGVLR